MHLLAQICRNWRIPECLVKPQFRPIGQKAKSAGVKRLHERACAEVARSVNTRNQRGRRRGRNRCAEEFRCLARPFPAQSLAVREPVSVILFHSNRGAFSRESGRSVESLARAPRELIYLVQAAAMLALMGWSNSSASFRQASRGIGREFCLERQRPGE